MPLTAVNARETMGAVSAARANPKTIARRCMSALLVLLAGCATLPPAPPLPVFEPLGGYRFATAARGEGNSSGLFVVLTFSGGGARAAALAYGVLEELARTDILWEGRRKRLLDEVDLISAVSGGSVTAAYYGLRGDAIFADFESRFLHREVQGEVARRIVNPAHWPRLLSPTFGRSDLVAEHFDELLFGGATFADLQARPGPFVILTATDMAAGTRFEFVQEQFDLMCLDLTAFSLARAVAASSAVPVLLSPIVVPNHAGRCRYPDLVEPIERARREGRLSPRQSHQLNKLASYLDAEQRPFVHLLDGGLADNLGLRSPLEAVFLQDGAWSLVQRIGIADVRKVVFIVVHAATGPDPIWSRSAALPGFGQVLSAFKDITIDRYSFETKELLAASFGQWAAEIKRERLAAGDAAGDELDFVMVDVDFESLADRDEREALMRIPTSWSLDAATVARVRAAARALLDASRPFRKLLRDLDSGRHEPGPRPAPQAGRRPRIACRGLVRRDARRDPHRAGTDAGERQPLVSCDPAAPEHARRVRRQAARCRRAEAARTSRRFGARARLAAHRQGRTRTRARVRRAGQYRADERQGLRRRVEVLAVLQRRGRRAPGRRLVRQVLGQPQRAGLAGQADVRHGLHAQVRERQVRQACAQLGGRGAVRGSASRQGPLGRGRTCLRTLRAASRRAGHSQRTPESTDRCLRCARSSPAISASARCGPTWCSGSAAGRPCRSRCAAPCRPCWFDAKARRRTGPVRRASLTPSVPAAAPGQRRSKRSRFITLVQARPKSRTSLAAPSCCA